MPGVGPVGGIGPPLTVIPYASADLEIECGCVIGYQHGPACRDRLTGRVPAPGLGPLPEWAHRPEPVPDLMPVLQAAKESVMDSITTNGNQPDVEAAPFGYKADGTPRKRRAPSPKQKVNAIVGRQRQAAAVANDPIIAAVNELEARITLLTQTRDMLRELLAT